MSVGRALGVSLRGLDGHVVEVEADIAPGIPHLSLVGLPDTAVSESRDRVRAAVVNSGLEWPAARMTVCLSPAGVRKVGSGFDLAIAVSLLVTSEQLPTTATRDTVFVGELGLDGKVRRVAGVLPAVIAALKAGKKQAVVPAGNLAEARLVEGMTCCGVETLDQLVRFLRGDLPLSALTGPPAVPDERIDDTALDLVDVVGQPMARWALEVAAAGGHHLLLTGAPGCGKTMLAERLPALLPDLDQEEALEVTAIHSVAGKLREGEGLIRRPPLRAPHHSASLASLIGSGSGGTTRPGAVSQAHRGVLFLDEAPEFGRQLLDSLRQPLESGRVEVARASGYTSYPARFQLVLAANDCPCGKAPVGDDPCTCPATVRARYAARLSGPLLDRVDIRVAMQKTLAAEMLEPNEPGESSSVVATRVAEARARQQHRLRGTPWRVNAEVPAGVIRRRWPVEDGVFRDMLVTGAESRRGVDKMLRLAWTLADLEGVESPKPEHVDAAGMLRNAM